MPLKTLSRNELTRDSMPLKYLPMTGTQVLQNSKREAEVLLEKQVKGGLLPRQEIYPNNEPNGIHKKIDCK